MSKHTFEMILEDLRPYLTKEDVVGDTIAPSTRLAITLARLVRGTYFYDIAETYGVDDH